MASRTSATGHSVRGSAPACQSAAKPASPRTHATTDVIAFCKQHGCGVGHEVTAVTVMAHARAEQVGAGGTGHEGPEQPRAEIDRQQAPEVEIDGRLDGAQQLSPVQRAQRGVGGDGSERECDRQRQRATHLADDLAADRHGRPARRRSRAPAVIRTNLERMISAADGKARRTRPSRPRPPRCRHAAARRPGSTCASGRGEA